MTKKEIAKFIYDELSYMYCDNCRYHSENGWGISMAEAERIAEMIGGKVETKMSLPKWIPVSDRLPKARESVILSTKEWTGEGCHWETTKHHVIWKGYGWNATYWDDEVIAWMPLPEPYREDGEV